jgi:hypothetical protein
MDQGVLTTSSPTFAALTLSGLTASTLVYSNASKAITSLANGTGALFNNGSGTLSYAAAIKADGTQALTADWNVGAFDLTANNFTASPTLGDEINTGFASWTAAAGWTYGSGKWTHSSGTTALTDNQSAVFDITKTYKIVVNYTWAGGGSSFTVAAGGQSYLAISSAAATSVTYYLYPSATNRLTITPTTGFTGSIDSVSIKETTSGVISNGFGSIGMGQFTLNPGNEAHVSLAGYGAVNSGLNFNSYAGRWELICGGTLQAMWSGNYFLVQNALRIGSSDTSIFRAAAATFQLGANATATGTTQTFKVLDVTGTNIIGAGFTLKAGNSTGNAVGGSFSVYTAPAGSSGAGVNAPLKRFEIDSTGATSFSGDNAQATNIKQASVVVTTTAAATATATNLIPAGSMVVGVTCRNTSAIAGDALTGYNVGDGTDADAWGANVSPNINETTDLTDCTVTAPAIYAAATSVVLTQVGGTTFTAGGTIRVTVHYINLTAPAT